MKIYTSIKPLKTFYERRTKMKGSTLCLVLVAILLIVNSCFAQKDIVVFTGVNARNTFTKENENDFVNFYHNIAINLGVSADFLAEDFILLSPTVEINIFPFPKENHPYATIHESSNPKLDISPSIIYRFLLELKIISSDKYTRQAYLLLGFGYSIEDISDIKITNYHSTEKVKFENTDNIMNTFGVGLIFSLNEKYAINVEGKFLTDYEKFDNSLNVGFMFKKIDLGEILF